MLLKNIEDFNLIKKFEDSLNPLPEVQSLPAALDKVVGFKDEVEHHPDRIHVVQVEGGGRRAHLEGSLPELDGGA